MRPALYDRAVEILNAQTAYTAEGNSPMFSTVVPRSQNQFEHGQVLFARAEALMDLGRPAEALAAITEATTLFDAARSSRNGGGPSDLRMFTRVRTFRAGILVLGGDLEAASSLLNEALRQASANTGDGSATAQRDLAEALGVHAKLLLARGQREAAKAELRRACDIQTAAIERDPTFVMLRWQHAGLLNALGAFPQALRVASDALQQAPSSALLLRERQRAEAGVGAQSQ